VFLFTRNVFTNRVTIRSVSFNCEPELILRNHRLFVYVGQKRAMEIFDITDVNGLQQHMLGQIRRNSEYPSQPSPSFPEIAMSTDTGSWPNSYQERLRQLMTDENSTLLWSHRPSKWSIRRRQLGWAILFALFLFPMVFAVSYPIWKDTQTQQQLLSTYYRVYLVYIIAWVLIYACSIAVTDCYHRAYALTTNSFVCFRSGNVFACRLHKMDVKHMSSAESLFPLQCYIDGSGCGRFSFMHFVAYLPYFHEVHKYILAKAFAACNRKMFARQESREEHSDVSAAAAAAAETTTAASSSTSSSSNSEEGIEMKRL